jgi:hypothetical protein
MSDEKLIWPDMIAAQIEELQKTMEAVLEALRSMGVVRHLDEGDRQTLADFYDKHR